MDCMFELSGSKKYFENKGCDRETMYNTEA